jgi:DNA-binding transcriptional ArsR family regulator
MPYQIQRREDHLKDDASKLAELLKVLASANRLMILCVLMEAPTTVGEIYKLVPGITQPALSQHLSQLKAHNILKAVKSGQKITYSIEDTRVCEIINTLRKYYCHG